MTIQKMKQTSFEKPDFSDWEKQAVQSLKGKPFESLITKTIEGIDLQPLYTKEQLENVHIQSRVTKKNAGWTIAQETIGTDGKSFLGNLQNSLARGNEAVVYDGKQPVQWDEASIGQLVKTIVKVPIVLSHVEANDPILTVFDAVPVAQRKNVSGLILHTRVTLPAGYENVRTASGDAWSVHHNGADAVTELALVLSQAAEAATKYSAFDAFAKDFFVRFAVDTHFFMEVAKFRAFRLLWQAFGKAYDANEIPDVPILATTSLRSYSKLDPHVNLLRAGNEAFAAVLGGADVITVYPHNVLTGSTESAVRLARNIQLVIRKETHVGHVIDPAGGAYFMEALTSELVEKAWARFLEIEASGGTDAFLKSGQLAQLLAARQVEVATGKKALIGTNVYADLTEPLAQNDQQLLIANRLAEPFEQLREQFAVAQPQTVLLTFGELKNFKPRADFVEGFLATGGIQSTWSPAFQSAQQAKEWLAQEKPDYAIVCAASGETEQFVEGLLQAGVPNVILDIAGKYDDKLSQKWQQAGINGFLYAGQHKVDKLLDIKSKWQGGRA
ncbi:methylmalonyl-CoA mutase family protein [Sporosarcina sp. HYO08]|uniref:methylmalonyl-CoA mutase family protein n=1 Tax=Sporosarcina sp. HYO08 TaxID=1759557 RepID=UPI0007946124|nr:methylmalonyl-CoA mutase family protein [Sporosarcina sp. HYO08]KXH87505.1 hypothetical protein AU377_02755 [Sporosarcina sp. HYO08]